MIPGKFLESAVARTHSSPTTMHWRFPSVLTESRCLALASALGCLLAASWRNGPRARGVALSARSVGTGETLFEKLPASETGVKLVNAIDISHPLKRLYVGGYASG